jgi:UPF0755 protein
MNDIPESGKTGWLASVLVIAVVALLVTGAVLLTRYQEFRDSQLTVPETGVVYVLKEGTSLSRLAQDLEQRGVICCPRFFGWLGRETDTARRLQTGEYRITADMNPVSLLETLTSGDVIQHALVIVEGQTFREVLATVRGSDTLQATLDAHDASDIMVSLGHANEHPEGRLLPDTYHFPSGTTDVAFLKRAYNAMAEKLAAAWDERDEDLPFRTPYEALILASIVEKETGQADERPLIAGVFVQRLRKGMRLQTDPTVIYGMGEDFDGNIRRRDLLADTPYNTYTRDGLPPTPIAMPGRHAIDAVMHPEENGYLYFVARGDGSHYFSRTLKEHNQAVKKYQLGQSHIKLPDAGQSE